MLQKVINDRIKLAMIGDFSNYENKALKDFVYECNNENDMFFVENEYKA